MLSFTQHLLFFIGIQSFTFLAGAFFPKMGFLKTVPVAIGLLVMYFIINSALSHNEVGSGFIHNLYNILTTKNFENVKLRDSMPFITYFWWGTIFLLVPSSWYIAYLRFKEMVV
jgi:hypothetical protein